ncbi:hypothetical protein WJX84_000174 [Apatococcus fuscideae]|uniref:ER membrane protein complex subunit 10 n=1 Tax=Apatococcus fuscideae TaxID=2026836 RepID=A0AAW1TF52_9CHLO
MSLTLEHAFGSGDFSAIGHLESPPRELREGPPHLEIKRDPFSAQQSSAFEQLVAQNGYYRLRVQPSEGAPIMTAMRARCLAGSGLREAFEAHLDTSGHVVALSWSTPTGSCQAQGGAPALPQGWSFAEVQRVPTRMPARGPSLHPARPAFSDPAQAMPEPQFLGEDLQGAGGVSGKAAGPKSVVGKDGKQVPQPEKTWLQKNWLLIMIGAAVVINIVSNANGGSCLESHRAYSDFTATATDEFSLADNERWCQRLQQAEYDELVAQQKCDKQSWEYLEYLQLDLTEAAAYHDLALATTSHTESSEYSQTMAKLIRTAIRKKLGTVHHDKEELLKTKGCLPSELIRNKALTVILTSYPTEGFVPVESSYTS